MERTILRATLAVALLAGATATVPALTRRASMPTDTLDNNKQIVRRLYEDAINRGKPELVAELISEDFVDSDGRRGPGAFARNLQSLRAGFPDIRFTIRNLIAEGDYVVVRWTWEATHTGEFRGLRPSGKRVTTSGISMYQLQRGKIVGVSLETDRLGVLQQIGAIPADVVTSGRR